MAKIFDLHDLNQPKIDESLKGKVKTLKVVHKTLKNPLASKKESKNARNSMSSIISRLKRMIDSVDMSPVSGLSSEKVKEVLDKWLKIQSKYKQNPNGAELKRTLEIRFLNRSLK